MPRQGRFDRFMDGVNRVPRPAMALGTLGLIVAAMVDPIWFAQRMQGVALVPEPLWWLMGAIVSFYFGSRYQAKGQDHARSVAETLGRAGEVAARVRALEALEGGAAAAAVAGEEARAEGEAPRFVRPARGPLDAATPRWTEWRAGRAGG